MLEIKQGTNAGQINSGSTAKCLKTQAFYSQVNSCQASFGIHLELTVAVQVALSALDFLLIGGECVVRVDGLV